MKKDKLYTVTKHNKQAINKRRFDGGGFLAPVENSTLGSSMMGGNISADFMNLDMSPIAGLLGKEKGLSIGSKSSSLGSIANIASAASAPIANMIGDGYSSGAGNMMQGLSSVAAAIPGPYGRIAGAALNVAGGLANRAFGMKVNQAKLNAANEGTNALKGFSSNASSFDDVQGPQSVANVQNAYKGGWFSGSKARKKNNALKEQRAEAQQFANNSVLNNVSNLQHDQLNNALANYSAFGGPLDVMTDDGIGAIGYDFMSDYLTMKNNQAQAKNSAISYLGNMTAFPTTFAGGGGIHIKKSKEGTFTAAAKKHGMGVQEFADHVLAHKDKYSTAMIKKANFARNARHWHGYGGLLDNHDTLFALGGDLQANGGDYSTGLTSIEAGSTHEENPYDGVQMGVAPDNTPNLVEEGETIFDDYVFSNRIHPTDDVLKKFHLYSKNSKLTYADVSKRLEKEAKERPNDPISRASLKKMLGQLAEAQENQKAEEEARMAREAFEALSPEEQQAVMQQIAQQQATQQQVAEQQAQLPEEMPEQIEPQDGNMAAAYGGHLRHVFDEGGGIAFRNNLMNSLGFSTLSDFNQWLKDSGEDPDKLDWEALAKDPQTLNFGVVARRNAALADALRGGYDFGVYKPNVNGYDLNAFNKVLARYMPSKKIGNAAGKYAIDQDFIKNNYDGQYADIRALEGSKAYRDYSDALVNVANAAKGLRFNVNNGVLENVDGQTYTPENLAMLNTLWNTAQGTATAPGMQPVPLFTENGDGTYSIADNAGELLVGADGQGGFRYDGKGGIFHLMPTPLNRTTQVVNRVLRADGTAEDIIGDVPKEWGNPVDTYTWNDPNTGYTYNYYRQPNMTATASEGEETANHTDDGKIPYRDERLRYAGLLGPAVGLGLWSAGVGKPDYSGLNAAWEISNRPTEQARFTPIGNYLTYRPMDIWAAQNRMDANSRATDRALTDNNAPIGTKMAGLLANGYNSQIGTGQLYRQALEYNDAQRQRVEDFNRATDQFNAEGAYRASAANAQMRNSARQATAGMAADVARQKMNADAAWNNALYGNISNLFEGISDLGRENAQHNMIAAAANSGAYGVLSDDMRRHSGGRRSKGGKIKKKRGLTF